MAVSCIRNASGDNYGKSPFIVDWLWGRYHVPQNDDDKTVGLQKYKSF